MPAISSQSMRALYPFRDTHHKKTPRLLAHTRVLTQPPDIDRTTGWRDGVTYDSAGSSVTTFNRTTPGTVQTADLGVILVTWVGTVGEPPPTVVVESGVGNGWTSIGGAWPDTANNMGWAVLSRVKQAADSATITVTLGDTRLVTAAIGWWSGKSAVGAVGTMYDRAGVSQATIAPTGISTAAGRTVALLFAERTATSGTTATLDAGLTRLFVEGTSTTDTTCLVGDLLASGTPTGTVTATYNSASGNGAGVQVELLPAPTVRSSAVYASAATEAGGTVGLPAGWQPGDVVYLGWELTATSGVVTTPSGWAVPVAAIAAAGVTNAHSGVFRRVMQAGDTDVAMTWTSGRFAANTVAVKDADTTTPEDVTPTTDDNTGVTTPSVRAPSITPTTAGCLYLGFFGVRNGTNGVSTGFTPDAALTEVNEASSAVTLISNAAIEAASQPLAAAAATGTRTATATGSVSTINMMGLSVAVRPITLGGGGTNAPAEVAVGTGTASDVQADIQVNDSGASGTGQASDPTASFGALDSGASGSGQALDAQAAVTANADIGTGTGTAADPVAAVGANAEAATGSGTALDATVQTSAGTSAPAEAATGVGSAPDPAVAITVNTEVASGTGTAPDPVASVGAQSGAATGTGTAADPLAAITVNAEAATGTGQALDATVSTAAQTNAPAEVASGTGTAPDSAVAVTVAAGLASGTGSAFDATVTSAVNAPAEVATGTGVAPDPSTVITILAGVASGIGSALDATVQIGTLVSAGLASGTGLALDVSVAVGVTAEFAVALGVALDVTAQTVLPFTVGVLSTSDTTTTKLTAGSSPTAALTATSARGGPS